MRKSPQYPVPALEKGLDVLETLAAVSVPQSLAELALRLERSSSELFRMLNCLESRGYILRDRVSGRYSLTLKLYSLAHTHSVEEKLLLAAARPMQELTEHLRESCHLSVLDRGSLLVLDQQESPEQVRVSIEVGGKFDPVETASGRLLMAYLGDAERTEILRASPSGRRLAGRSLGSWSSGVAEIRRRGYASAAGETIEGVRDLAVLVGNPGAGIMAALAVTRLLRRGQRERDDILIAAMKTTASQITGTLGLAAAA